MVHENQVIEAKILSGSKAGEDLKGNTYSIRCKNTEKIISNQIDLTKVKVNFYLINP